MSALRKRLPRELTVEEFLGWEGDGTGRLHELVDGRVRAMAPATPTHGLIQAEVARRLGNHLLERPGGCNVVEAAGVVPRVRADINLRIPDLAVTCTPDQEGQRTLAEPRLLVEILSPTNRRETWQAVWAYTTIPSLQEIVVIESMRVQAHLLRRQPDASWPERPEEIGPGGTLRLASIGFACALHELYRTTRFAQP
jgi:Uma2 family endonuclease